MKKVCSAVIKAAIAIMGAAMAFHMPVASAATSHFQLTQKQIEMDGKTVSRPYSLVYQKTTYMPIWYVMNLLQSFDVKSHWNGQMWNLVLPSTVSPSYRTLTTGTSGETIALNGHVIEHVKAVTATDPASGQVTTFMPIWYIMQLLNQFHIHSSWQNGVWKLDASQTTLPHPTAQAASGEPNPNTSVTSNSANADTSLISAANPIAETAHIAMDDSAYFERASNHMYMSAQTNQPLSSTAKRPSMDKIAPGQTVYLYTWEDGTQLDDRGVRWFVNSPNATIVPDTSHHWRLTSASGDTSNAAAATFAASKAGVYTIQAEAADGTYSVPLTVIVGVGSFPAIAPNLADGVDGISAFTASANEKPVSSTVNGQGTTYFVYPPTAGGWLPISGQTTEAISQVQVTFGDNPGLPAWSYAIPVDNQGHFAADVRVPLSGHNLTVALFTNFTEDMTHWGNGENATDNPQTVHVDVSAAKPTNSAMDLFASAKMDFNVNPAIGQLAMQLFQQAGSTDSAIEAINNYVADDLIYDQSELQPNGYRFQNSSTTWKTKLGVCEDYAELEASMLKAIGIPTKTIQGRAEASAGTVDQAGQNGDNHEWIEAWDGTKWVIADPTWSSADDSDTSWLTNEFFTNTLSFQTTHKVDEAAIGSPE